MSEEQETSTEKFKCPVPGCTFESDSKKGLAGHMRLAHQSPTKADGLREAVDGIVRPIEEAWEERLDRLESKLEALQKKPVVQEGHKTMQEIDACERCREAFGVDGYRAQVVKEAWMERMGLSAECEQCGYPVEAPGRDGFSEETAEKTCPICGFAKAKRRDVPRWAAEHAEA
jgi:ribosomal protein L37E